MSFTFTVSKEDFKDYFRCPRKLSLKVMGFKVREFKRKEGFVSPTYAIGLSGEKLTEQILEIIASVQAEKSGEMVEVLTERGSDESKIIRKLSKLITLDEKAGLREVGKELVSLTVKKAFETDAGIQEEYGKRIIQETSRKFMNLMGDLYNKFSKIKSVYKPVLKNRDICSLGYPDFQVDTEQGQVLIEVKNWANLNSAISEGKHDLLYYNSLLKDKMLGASTHISEKLPTPINSILVIPRHGIIQKISDPIPKYREIAVEIWKIKRAAIVEKKLPYVKTEPSICKRCGFKKYCHEEGETLEQAKPLPLISAIARKEAEEDLEKSRKEMLRLPNGFSVAYFTLKKEAAKGNLKALEKMNALREFITQRHRTIIKKEIETLFKAMPNEFEEWGGKALLNNYYMKISRTTNMLFPQIEDKIEEIIRVSRRKWNV